MAGAVGDDDDDVIASINMIPFIDISLVLLIIFMVTSAYIVRQAIEVDLPRAAAGSEVAPSTLSIVVLADGGVQLNGDSISLAALETAVRAEVAADANTQAIIAGDRTADYGAVVDVVDAIKGAGIRSFALNIEKESP